MEKLNKIKKVKNMNAGSTGEGCHPFLEKKKTLGTTNRPVFTERQVNNIIQMR